MLSDVRYTKILFKGLKRLKMACFYRLYVKKLILRLIDVDKFLIVVYANTFKGLLKRLKMLFNVFLMFGRLKIFLYTFNFFIFNNINFLINIIYCTIDFFY